MKLIDKEALLLALRKKRYSKQSLDLIESQPVVKAVPTEWIEQFMNRFRLDMVTGDEYALLHYMLTEWEIENEKDI